MLKSIHIESFRTLKSTTVHFKEGLNVIIGKNGVGKSNLLGFLSQATRVFNLGFATRRFAKLATNFRCIFSYINSENKKVEIEFKVNRSKSALLSEKELENDIRITTKISNKIVDRDISLSELQSKRKFKDIEKALRESKPFRTTYIKFSIPEELEFVTSPSSLTIDESGDVQLNWDPTLKFITKFLVNLDLFLVTTKHTVGKDLDSSFKKTDILHTFQKTTDESSIVWNLKSFTNVADIRLGPNINIYENEGTTLIENIVLEFKVDGAWMPWSYLSDGTKRSFYLISEVLLAENQLILIEEPEIGLHPRQLGKVMRFLKEQSDEKQIILSTHSPVVLDILNPSELDQIIIATIEKNTSHFKNLNAEQKEKAMFYMNEVGDLSTYWLHSDLEDDD